MSGPANTPPKGPHRRRFAVSVRALMIAILAIGVGLGWRIDRAGRQKRAVARIEKSGGIVHHDFEFDGTYPYKPGGKPRAPDWLRARLGDEFSRK